MKVLKHNPDEGCGRCPLLDLGIDYYEGCDTCGAGVDLPNGFTKPAPSTCPLRPENGGGVQVLAETGDQ